MAASEQFRNLSSTLKQNLQGIWQKPAAVSALASLGLHGLLFVVLPLLPYAAALQATEPEIQQPVELVELSPEEQRRLPDFSTLPPIELPKITNPPQVGTTAPDLFSFSNLPKPSASTPFSLPNDSLLAPPPLPIFIPPAPPTAFPSFSIQIPPPAPATQPSPAPAAPSASPPASPDPNPRAVAKPEEAIPNVATEATPGSPQPEAVAAAPESPEAADLAPRSQDQIRQDLIAEQQKLRELYTYNGAGTTEGNAQVAFADWFYEGLDKKAEDFKQLQEAETTVAYPRLACPLKPDADEEIRRASVGVVVDANNQIVGEPQILQSSGYSLFNQEALRTIQSYPFENSTGEQQVYLVGVNFEYSEEACPPGLTPLEPAS